MDNVSKTMDTSGTQASSGNQEDAADLFGADEFDLGGAGLGGGIPGATGNPAATIADATAAASHVLARAQANKEAARE